MCVELNACDTDGGYFTGFNKTKLDALKAIRVGGVAGRMILTAFSET